MRSAAQVQKDINKALKESGGAWTSQLNALVSERSAAREAEKGGSVPRETEIMGQRHMLAYINEDERRLLKNLGGADIPGPAGIPSFPPKAVAKAGGQSGPSTSTKTVSTPAGTKTVSTAPAPSKTVEVKSTAALREEKAAKDAAATAAAQARVAEILRSDRNDRDDRAPAGTYVPSAPAAPPPAQVTREPEPYSPPVVDLGVINIAPEPDYSYDPYAESLQSWFNEMSPAPSAPVVDPVAEARARERAAAEAAAAAARTRAQLEALDAARRTTGVQPGLTSAAIDPFAATPLGPQEARGRTGVFEASREEPSLFERNLGLGPMFTSGVGATLQLLGNVGQVLTGDESAPVGYGAGEVDPRLASAVDRRMAEELGYIPTNLPPSDLFNYFEDMAGAGEVLRERAIRNAPTEAQELYTTPILTEEGFNTPAFLVKGASTLMPTLFGLAGVPFGKAGLAATGAGLTAGEVALEARAQAEADAIASGYTPEQAAVIGQVAAERAAGPGAVAGGISNVLFGPLPGSKGILSIPAGAAEEAFVEGVVEPSISNIAAQTAMGRYLPDQPFYGATGSMDEAILGAAGGALLSGIGTIPAAPSVPAVPPSVTQPVPPFIPAAPAPGFTPGAGPAATMTVEGTATDVTPGFRPTGPSVGQVAQTPPGLLTAYQQAADTMREAGVRGVGGTPSTMMDVAAATEIINNEIAETGGLSPETALNLERATGLSATAIKDIAETAPRVGTARDTLITDVVTGTGGGGQIQVTANPNGTYTLRNLTTGNPQHVATVEPGQSLDEAIKVFDEVTTVGSPEAIRVDTAGTATLPPAQLTREPAPYTSPAAEPTTALVPTRPTGIATLPSVGAGTQLDTAQPVDLTADSQTTSEILEFTPAEDFIEGTAVEIAGQIPGTVATTTAPETTSVATTTAVSPVTTSVTTVAGEEDMPEEPGAPEVEEEPGAGAEEPDTEVTIQEAVDEAAEEEEAPFECPEGYTAVKLAGRWVCQKTETSTVGRPTIGTRPYLSEVGFAGPSPYPPSTRTVTRTVTAAE